MSIRQSLLALLSEHPRHGYELKSEFDHRTGNSWPLNIGQVYTTLDRLERDALVTRADADAEGRVTYAITDAGRAQVQEWFAQPVVLNNPPRNELAIKIAIAASMEGVDITTLIQTQRRASIQALQNYTRAARTADPEDLAWHLIIQSMIHQTEAEVRWLDHCESAAIRAAQRRPQFAPSPSHAEPEPSRSAR